VAGSQALSMSSRKMLEAWGAMRGDMRCEGKRSHKGLVTCYD
jgi:hypothetical protein